MDLTIIRLTNEALLNISYRDYAAAIESLDRLKNALEVGEAESIPDLD